MFKLISEVTKHILTEKDGVSFDNTKVMGVIGCLIFFGLTVYQTIMDFHSFNPINWGIAFASILGATAAGVKIKESTEQTTATGSTATQMKEGQ